MDIDSVITQEYQKGTPIRDIISKVGISKNSILRRARRLGLRHPGRYASGGIIDVDVHQKENTMREPTQNEKARIERLLEKEGYRPDWSVAWVHLQDDGIKTTTLLRNPELAKKDEENKKAFLEEIKKHAPKYPATRYGKVKDGHLKLIDLADLHISKYAIGRDGSIAYDTNMAVARAHAAVSNMLQKTQGFPTEKFWLPIGNDILHIDNKNSTTTKGTFQDAQGMWWQAYRAAHKMYVEVIERLAKVAPVEVFYNRSNHDEHLGFCLAEGLAAHFHKAKSVTFTIEPQNDRVYMQYGKNMIGFDHGDGAKDTEIPHLMACEAAQMWADCTHRYFMRHHLHHHIKVRTLVGKDYPGVTLQYMRSPSAADPWHAFKGYTGSPQAIDSFMFHPETGQAGYIPCVFA